MSKRKNKRWLSYHRRVARVNEKGRFRWLALIPDSGKARRIRLLKLARDRGIPLNIEGARKFDDPDLVKLRKKGLISTQRVIWGWGRGRRSVAVITEAGRKYLDDLND